MWNTRINAFKKQRLMPSAVMLVGIVPNWFSLDAIYSQRIVYERFNPCKQTLNDDCNTFRVSIRQQRMRKSSRSCLLLRVSVCVCQQRKNQPTLWPGSWGGLGRGHALSRALTLTLLSTLFFLPARMKRLFRPAVPLQAQLWSLTLFRENISFTLWCLLFYKKANPSLKIARLV